MKVHLSFEVFDKYLKIKLSGGNPYEEINEILATIKKLMEENNRNRVLIDAFKINTPSEMEKFFIGKLGADVLGRQLKIAIFVEPGHINKFFENVAVNRGGQLYVADSEQEALSWLLQ